MIDVDAADADFSPLGQDIAVSLYATPLATRHGHATLLPHACCRRHVIVITLPPVMLLLLFRCLMPLPRQFYYALL